jgi:hypothetical protein
MTDVVALYNPANAAALTADQVEGLQKLTTDELGQLAKAYPNGSIQRAYLLIVDGSKPAGKQLPSLSTFQNLYNLRIKNGLKSYVAIGFKGQYKPVTQQPLRVRKSEVLDLSDQELLTLPGFKAGKGTSKEETIAPETVKVTKVKEAKPTENKTPKPKKEKTTKPKK